MLGIIVGVASVLAMIAVGDGAKTIILRDADKLGSASQFSMFCGGWVQKKGAGCVIVAANIWTTMMS